MELLGRFELPTSSLPTAVEPSSPCCSRLFGNFLSKKEEVAACLFHCFRPCVSPCGSRCGSSRHLCVKETTDGLRRHIPFGRFSLIIDSGDFLNESLLLLAGFRPRHAEFPAHRKKDTINKRSKLHRPHLLSSIPQSLQKIKWQIEAAAVTLFVLKTHRCNQKAAAAFLLHFQSSLAVFLDFNSFLNILRPEFSMCSTPACGVLCGQRQRLAGAAPVRAL